MGGLAAFMSISDMAALSFPWLPVRFMVRMRFDNFEKLERVRVPPMVIHGDRPVRDGRALVRARCAAQAFALARARRPQRCVLHREGALVIEALRTFMSAPHSM